MHIYNQNGKLYPSVTTIIHLISANDELMKWANVMGFKRKDIKKIQDESATFGTLVHSQLQKRVDTSAPDPIEIKNNVERYQIDKILSNFDNTMKPIKYDTIFTEKTIISEELGYAGTLDWYYRWNSLSILNDFKTSKRIRPTMFLQLGGYYNLLNTIGEEPDIGSITIANEKGCSIHPISKENLINFGIAFDTLYSFYKLWNDVHNITPDYSLLK